MKRFFKYKEKLCISVDALAESMGIELQSAFNTIKTGLKRNREGSNCWDHFDDPEDSRRKWIIVDELPETTRERAIYYYGDIEEAFYSEMFLDKVGDYVAAGDYSWFLKAQVKADGTAFTTTEANNLSEACGWLRMLADGFNRHLFSGKLTYYGKAALVLGARQLYGLKVSNGRVLQRRVKRWKADGRESLISGLVGNRNAVAIPDLGIKRVLSLYGDFRKPSIRDVAMVYNSEAPLKGWPEVSTERIRQILQEPVNRQKWFAARHGKEAYRNQYERTLKRRKPSFPDAIWSIDGLTVQLYYVNSRGELKSDLYCVAVMDVFSDKVVGYALGSTETGHLVQRALRDAVRKTMYFPIQAQYDNSKANLSKEVEELMPRLASIDFPTAPYNGKSKPIENLIGRLEGRNMRYMENFKGGNITSHSLERKANPDALMKLVKEGKIPSREAAIAQFELIIETHNHEATGDGLTPNERYGTPHEKRRPADPLLVIEAFWVERPKKATYTKDGLIIQVGKERITYEVESERGVENKEFRKNWIGQRFTIKYDPDDLYMIALYHEDTLIEYAVQKYEFPMAVVDAEEGEGKILAKALKARKEHIDEGLVEFEEIKQEVEEAGFATLSHQLLKKDSYNRMEGRMLDELLQRSGRTQKVRKNKSRKHRLVDASDADGSIIES